MRVLLIEDEPLVSFLLEDIVRELGYDVVAKAATRSEAEQVARTIDVDLALVDINLYGVASFAAAQMLQMRDIPFIFVTGSGSSEAPPSLRNIKVLKNPYTFLEVATAMSVLLHPDGCPQ